MGARNRSAAMPPSHVASNAAFKSPAPSVPGVRNYLKPPSKQQTPNSAEKARNLEVETDTTLSNMLMKHSMSEPTVTDFVN